MGAVHSLSSLWNRSLALVVIGLVAVWSYLRHPPFFAHGYEVAHECFRTQSARTTVSLFIFGAPRVALGVTFRGAGSVY